MVCRRQASNPKSLLSQSEHHQNHCCDPENLGPPTFRRKQPLSDQSRRFILGPILKKQCVPSRIRVRYFLVGPDHVHQLQQVPHRCVFDSQGESVGFVDLLGLRPERRHAQRLGLTLSVAPAPPDRQPDRCRSQRRVHR